MYQSIKQSLRDWSNETSDRQKLQHTYIAAAIALLLFAGVLGLMNHALGQQVLAAAIIAAAVFLANAVTWALLQSFVLLRLSIQPKTPEIELSAKPKTTTKSRKK